MKKEIKKNKKKVKSENAAFLKIKSFFNKPTPIIIFLIALISFMLLFITSYIKKTNMLVGAYESEDIVISSIHLFTNADMNYFYASPARYKGDEEIYSFQIGYYVIDEKGDYIEFATRTRTLDNPVKLSEVIEEQSPWDFAEPASGEYFFTKDVMDNLDRMHFVIKASTKKDSKDADIVKDEDLKLERITK